MRHVDCTYCACVTCPTPVTTTAQASTVRTCQAVSASYRLQGPSIVAVDWTQGSPTAARPPGAHHQPHDDEVLSVTNGNNKYVARGRGMYASQVGWGGCWCTMLVCAGRLALACLLCACLRCCHCVLLGHERVMLLSVLTSSACQHSVIQRREKGKGHGKVLALSTCSSQACIQTGRHLMCAAAASDDALATHDGHPSPQDEGYMVSSHDCCHCKHHSCALLVGPCIRGGG